jgi:plasmid stabilization system protein ParE
VNEAEIPISWRIEETDGFDAERQQAFLYLIRVAGPDYAGRWLTGLVRAIAALAEFPGPRAHALQELASERFRVEVRRLPYDGPGHRRRGGTRYRILFSVADPAYGELEGVIRILRIRHSSADEGASSDENR